MNMNVFKIEVLKKNTFMNNYCYNNDDRFSLTSAGYKTRMVDYRGVYKSNKLYQITLTRKDMIELAKTATDNEYSIELSDICKALEIDPKHVVCYYNSNDGLPNHVWNKSFKNFYRNTTVDEIIYWFALKEDFVRCEPTAKELEIAKNVREREANVTMLNAFAKDNIVRKLKERGHNFVIRDNAFYLPKTEEYNRFLDKAIEYYLNDIVKELKVTTKSHTVNRPKQHIRTSSDCIFTLSDTKLDFDGGNK